MKVIIDRFENGYAVCECEDKTMLNIDKNKLPAGAEEGTVLIIEKDLLTIDINETKNRKNRIKKLAEDIWE